MKLFGGTSNADPKKEESWQDRVEGKVSLYRVAIVSEDEEKVEQIKSILVLYNILRVQVFPVDFLSLKDNVALNEFDVVLVDIDSSDDIELINTYLTQYIPVDCLAYAFGNNDSISFAHELEQKGIKYLLCDVQMSLLPMLLSEGSNKTVSRQGNIVTFLGCKGGAGTSHLVYNTVKAISVLSKIPMLFVQGASGSSDIDFIVEKPIEKDGSIVALDDNLSIRIEPAASAWDFNDSSTYQYNLVIFDHDLNSQTSFSHLNDAFSVSNTVVVVINRDPYSIKMAKSILDERNRMIVRHPSLEDKRFFICLNDNKLVDKKQMLTEADIVEYLEHPIDIQSGYFNTSKKLKEGYKSKEIKAIASLLIGIEGRASKSFSGLMKKDKSFKSFLFRRNSKED